MSSNGDRGAGIGDRDRDRDRFDTAIDLAVREMLDVEPPPGLRGRVMDRIERNDPVVSADHPVASAFRRNPFVWLAVPVAAAAVIVLAILAPWRDGAAPATAPAPPPVVAQRETPRVVPPDVAPPLVAPGTRPTSPNAGRIASNEPPRSRAVAPRPGRLVEAAAVAAVEDTNFTAIDALAGPESIAIERLADPLPSSMRSIEPAPLQIRALEITALPEAPRERREE